MSKIGTIVKVGGSILAGIGGVVAATPVITSQLQQNEVVVEEYEYTNSHKITITDKYYVNGVEYSYEEWLSVKETCESVSTGSKAEVVDEEGITIYYGAVDSPNNIDLSKLTSVSLNHTYETFRKTIASGNEELDKGQYVVIVVPNTVSISEIKVSGFSISFGTTRFGNYKVYYGSTATWDLEGTTYTFVFEK